MIVNEPTGFKDVNKREIFFGDTIEIITSKVDSLVSEGQQYKVFVGENGTPSIQVGVALEEVAPHYCEIVDDKKK